MRTLIKCLVSHTNVFLLDAKGSENAQGEFSEFPPGNPKTPHTPTNEKRARREHSPPYLRGAKGNRYQAEELDGYKRTSKDKAEKINRVCFFAIKADGKECRPLFMNYNFLSLSRARKICCAQPKKFFGANP